MERRELPGVVAHADWSVDAAKRWLATAVRDGDVYRVEAPIPVDRVGTLLRRLEDRSPDGRVFVGFDFPIGIPRAYAIRAGLESFRGLLLSLGTPPWDAFFQVAERPAQVSIHRPFYPFRPGGTSQAQLVDRLGLTGSDELLRRCERSTPSRPRASPLFWTLGAKQVGRAALSGWREVLVPALRRGTLPPALWPFDGELTDLLSSARCVIAETYPAEACAQLGLGAPGLEWRKTDRVDRQRVARRLDWARVGRRLTIDPGLRRALEAGFGSDPRGEDRFDAAIGLLSMLAVVLGKRPATIPVDPELIRIEGWILGQSPSA